MRVCVVVSFPKRERWNAWTSGWSRSNKRCVVLFVSSNCVIRLTTSLPCSLCARGRRRARAHTQRYVGRTNQTPPLERPSRKNNNRANRSRRSARASSLAWRISPRISTRRCWRRRRRYERRVRGRRRCRRCCRTR